MEKMVDNSVWNSFSESFKNKRVLVTGHTGFKGSWLTKWLTMLGAKVYGYSIDIPTKPSLFKQLEIQDQINHFVGDVRDSEEMLDRLKNTKPDVVFHLAAQPLVRASYQRPQETWETNVNGIVNLLESIRRLELRTSVIVITSDKCYENREWIYSYRENDSLGGFDPYSSSKAGAELVVSSWRNSFFQPDLISLHGVKLASVRAGNVIGGGDWATDRIVPDAIRSIIKEDTLEVRNPHATRPWQHVLESLGGYLLLGKFMLEEKDRHNILCSSFNFGPYTNSNKSVKELLKVAFRHWKGNWKYEEDKRFHEANLLNLNIDKVNKVLGWSPGWDFETTVQKTMEWYRVNHEDSKRTVEITEQQIRDYSFCLSKIIAQ